MSDNAVETSGSAPQRPPERRYAERWAVGMLLLFVALVIAAAAASGIDDMRREIAKVDATLLAKIFALGFASFLLRFWRWHRSGVALGVKVPAGPHLLIFFAGFAMTVTPGKVGEILRLWLLRQGYGYRYETTAPMLLVDRLSDVSGIAIVGCLGAVALGAYLEVSVFVLAVALAVNFAFLRPAWCLRLTTMTYTSIGRFPRLFARIRIVFRHMKRISAPSVYGPILFASIAGWMLECISFYLLLQQLGADIEIAAAAVVFCLSILVGVATLLPGGVGGTELGIVGLLIALGVSDSVAVTATALIRLTTLWFAVALGMACLTPAMRLVRTRVQR